MGQSQENGQGCFNPKSNENNEAPPQFPQLYGNIKLKKYINIKISYFAFAEEISSFAVFFPTKETGLT